MDEGDGDWDVLSVPGAPIPPMAQSPVEYVESSVQLSRAAPISPGAMAGVQAPGVAPLPAQMLQDLGVSHILIDVTPRTLAIQTVQGYCDPIIERNSPIPIEQSRVFTTSRDDQETVVIKICQGEARRIEENTVLGEVMLTGIRPAPRGEVKVSVTFEIDTDGIVSVSARDVDTGQQAGTRVTVFGGLSDDEVRDLVRRYGRS
jgi:molecular chaperone DnaK